MHSQVVNPAVDVEAAWRALPADYRIPEQPATLAESLAYCERLARAHYENFPVGSLLVPKSKRPHVYSIYAFARTADDFADEGYGTGLGESERLDLTFIVTAAPAALTSAPLNKLEDKFKKYGNGRP